MHCSPQTLDEVAYAERIKTQHRSNYLRQENEVIFCFIRSCPFGTHVTGIKIDSTADLSEKAIIIESKEIIATIQG